MRVWKCHTAISTLLIRWLQTHLYDAIAYIQKPTSARSFSLPGFGSTPVEIADDGALVIGAARLLAFTYRSYSAVDVSNFQAQYRANRSGAPAALVRRRDLTLLQY